MKNKRKNEIENIVRMNEIAKIYRITKQYKKCEKYHKNIIVTDILKTKLCLHSKSNP